MTRSRETGRQLYFLHIPKTAGTSLVSFIQRHFAVDEYLYQASGWSELWSVTYKEFERTKFIRGHFGINLLKMFSSKPQIITFLRNPFERVVSHYNHFHTFRESRLAETVQDENLSIDDFVKDRRMLVVVRNCQVRSIGLDLPIEFFWKNRSMEYLEPDVIEQLTSKDLYGAAVQNLRSFDFVGLAEHFDLSLCCLCRRFNWVPDFSGSRMRQSRKDGSSVLNPETRSIIQKETQLDQRLYEAGKGLLLERLNSEFGFALGSADLDRMTQGEYRNLVEDAATICRSHYRKSFGPPSSRVEWTATQPIHGAGWHDVHGLDDVPHRWSGPGNLSSLDLPLAAGADYKLSIFILRFIKDEIRDGLELYVSDQKVSFEFHHLDQGNWLLVAEIHSSSIANDGPTTFSFRIPATYSFAELGYDDSDFMKRGFALQRFEVRPSQSR